MIANYHTHTWRCNHAYGTEREYVERAIQAGLSILGFSDHTPYPFPNGHVSGFRMMPDQLDDYCKTVLALREEYAGQLEIHLGLEVEYYPDCFADLLSLCSDYPIEYFLLGQHCINNEYDFAYYSGEPTRNDGILNRYVDQVIEGMQTGRFLYVAHPDIIHYTGRTKTYRAAVRRLCSEAVHLHIPLEINCLGLSDRRNYPDERFWEVAAEEGATAVIGSDAHRPENVCVPAALEKAEHLARKYGLPIAATLPLPTI